MSKDINKEAYKQAEKELLENKVKEVKDFILQTLNKIESKKKEKSRVEEELRVLKLDIEDLRHGNFEKIEERREKSKVARGVSVDFPSSFVGYSTNLCIDTTLVNSVTTCTDNNSWITATAGTYQTNTGNAVYLSAN